MELYPQNQVSQAELPKSSERAGDVSPELSRAFFITGRERAEPSLSLIPDKQVSTTLSDNWDPASDPDAGLELRSERDRIRSCGKIHIVMDCSCCGKKYRVPARCNSRFCPKCARIRSAKLIEKYRPYLKAMKHLFFVTLTVKNTPDLTKKAIDSLIGSFRELRRREGWRPTWGLWALEVTNEGKGYNLHIHAVVNRFINASWLRKTWGELTGSRWVFLQYSDVGRREGAPRELLKYVTKLSKMTGEAFDLMTEVFKGRRLVNCFGSKKYRLWLKFNSSNKQISGSGEVKPWLTCQCGSKLRYQGMKTEAELTHSILWRDFLTICELCGEHHPYFAPHICKNI